MFWLPFCVNEKKFWIPIPFPGIENRLAAVVSWSSVPDYLFLYTAAG
jgi:hypothetical protein